MSFVELLGGHHDPVRAKIKSLKTMVNNTITPIVNDCTHACTHPHPPTHTDTHTYTALPKPILVGLLICYLVDMLNYVWIYFCPDSPIIQEDDSRGLESCHLLCIGQSG